MLTSPRTYRYLLFLIVVALVVFVAAGCGGSDDSGSTKSSAKTKTESKDTSDSAADEEDEDANEESAEDVAKQEAIDAGQAYDGDVAPLLDELAPLLTRIGSVSDKLQSGQVSVAVATAGFGRQADDSDALVAQLKAIEVEDELLAKAHPHLTASIAAYAGAMRAMSTLSESDSEATLNAKLAKTGSLVDRATSELTAWSELLDGDSEGRLFPLSMAATMRVGAAAEKL